MSSAGATQSQRTPSSARASSAATRAQRELRASLAAGVRGSDGGSSLEAGIGGAARPERLKCLHAHVAWALAQPPYTLGEAILRESGGPWPADRCCLDGL